MQKMKLSLNLDSKIELLRFSDIKHNDERQFSLSHILKRKL